MKTYKYKPCARCGRNVVHEDSGETLCFACLVSPCYGLPESLLGLSAKNDNKKVNNEIN